MINLKWFYLFIGFVFIQNIVISQGSLRESFHSILIAFIFWIIIRIIYKRMNKFNSNKPTIPIYKLKEKYNPVLAGYLYDNSFQIKDWYAGIVYLIKNKKIFLFKKENKYFIKANFDKIYDTENILDSFLLKSIFYKKKCWKEISKDGVWNCWTSAIDIEKFKKEISISGFIKNPKELLIVENSFLGVYTERQGFSKVNHILGNFIFLLMAIISPIIIGNIFDSKVWIASFPYFMFFVGWLLLKNNIFVNKNGWEVKNELEGLKEFFSKTEDNNIIHYSNLEEFIKNKNASYLIALSNNNDWIKFFS